jgi:phenylalanyl-tRNA synthetase alpha chain
MNYTFPDVISARASLQGKFATLADKKSILKAPEIKDLFAKIKIIAPEDRKAFGAEVNSLKQEIEKWLGKLNVNIDDRSAIDVTAPFDVNSEANGRDLLLPAINGTVHPLNQELNKVLSIFEKMGFTISESRELDDDYHMFTSLNFPEGHPARDDYDTFMTVQTDKNGKQFIAPAQTSTMQNRILRQYKTNLDIDEPIAVVIPGRVFRNEDLDARHEHTFYQIEGIYVDRGVNVGNLLATLKTFLVEYYQKDIEIKTQPFYFPFTEPSFEFALSCPFCDKKGCSICSQAGWIELLGCGLINPNVLKMAGIDPEIYTGFAWGGGIERLVMMKNNIEDIRHFESGKLEFLRQF